MLEAQTTHMTPAWGTIFVALLVLVAIGAGLSVLLSGKESRLSLRRTAHSVLTGFVVLPVLAVVCVLMALIVPFFVVGSPQPLQPPPEQHEFREVANIVSPSRHQTIVEDSRIAREERSPRRSTARKVRRSASREDGSRQEKEHPKIRVGNDEFSLQTSREQISLTIGDFKIGYPSRKQESDDDAGLPATVEEVSEDIVSLGDAEPLSSTTQDKTTPADETVVEAGEGDAARPDWLDQKQVSLDTDAHVVQGNPELTPHEAVTSALRAAGKVVKERFNAEYGDLGEWEVPLPTVEQYAARDRYIEPYQIKTPAFPEGNPDVPTMYTAYLLVDTSPDTLGHFYEPWKERVVQQRLWAFGGLFALVTLIIGTTAGYLQIDGASKGAYRGRLKLAAVALIVAGGLALVRVLPLAG